MSDSSTTPSPDDDAAPSDETEDRHEAARHPIGVVARRTGLKPDLIRAWERRYGAVEPERTESRRRYYTDGDIDRLSLLKRVVDGGHSIGQVANLPPEELEDLLAPEPTPAPPVEAGRPAVVPPADGDVEQAAERSLERCLQAVRQLDARELELQLERASLALSRFHMIEHVLVPLVRRIGELWQAGELRPVHEHLASAVVRSFVGSLRRAFRPPEGSPTLVVTTPARQQHELGAMIVGAYAAAEGWDVVYLGPDLPAEDIAAAAHQKNARAVALSIVYPPDDPYLGEELEKIDRLLPAETRLLIGGRAARHYAETLEPTRAVVLEGTRPLREVLADLRR